VALLIPESERPPRGGLSEIQSGVLIRRLRLALHFWRERPSRWWPNLIPTIPAFLLNASTVLFITLDIFATGVLDFEWALISAMSFFVQARSLRFAIQTSVKSEQSSNRTEIKEPLPANAKAALVRNERRRQLRRPKRKPRPRGESRRGYRCLWHGGHKATG